MTKTRIYLKSIYLHLIKMKMTRFSFFSTAYSC